jgi:hypothetical protein
VVTDFQPLDGFALKIGSATLEYWQALNARPEVNAIELVGYGAGEAARKLYLMECQDVDHESSARIKSAETRRCFLQAPKNNGRLK